MVDAVVLLTPLVVLLMAAFLGFAGCGFSGSGPVEVEALAAVARVPQDLAVTLIRFDWTDPDDNTGDVSQQDPEFVEEGDDKTISLLLVDSPILGPWLVRCTIEVRDSNGNPAQGEAPCDFPLDPLGAYARVTFEASLTDTFSVICKGVSY
jgi:hypothetical protein